MATSMATVISMTMMTVTGMRVEITTATVIKDDGDSAIAVDVEMALVVMVVDWT